MQHIYHLYEEQKANMLSAIHLSFNIHYPFIGYDEFVRIRGERPIEKMKEVIEKDLEKSVQKIMETDKKVKKIVKRRLQQKVKHPKLNRRNLR